VAYAAGIQWTPITLPIKAPTATEMLDRFDEVVRWVEKFQQDSRASGGLERFRIECRTVRGRNLGANEVPARIWIDSFEQLCALLGTKRDVRSLDGILEQTSIRIPGLLPWVIDHPHQAIEHREIWGEVLDTVAWIATHDTRHLYLRQIDVEGVDTKFVEHQKRLLDNLLTSLLPPERIHAGHTDFARRFGFRSKPDYTRFRLLSRQPGIPAGLSELRLRTDEFARFEPEASTVFIVENEITYLAFPRVVDSIVVFGSGFGLTVLKDLDWLDHKQIVYWGDIDTHGFAILSMLRSRFPSVLSVLMDHETLLAHPKQWGKERDPTNRALPHLTEPEEALYRDLIEDRYGHWVQLEQERERFSLVGRALQPWTA
jgi:hypothetical protein